MRSGASRSTGAEHGGPAGETADPAWLRQHRDRAIDPPTISRATRRSNSRSPACARRSRSRRLTSAPPAARLRTAQRRPRCRAGDTVGNAEGRARRRGQHDHRARCRGHHAQIRRRHGADRKRRGAGAQGDLRSSPEFALLDVNLGAETSFEIAKRLAEAGVPFVFATGYGEQVAFPRNSPMFPSCASHTRSTRCARRSNAGPTRPNATGADVRCSTRLPVKRRVTTLRSATSSTMMALALFQDEVGALARRQDVLVQIDEIDARPDRGRGLDRLLVRQASHSGGNTISDRGTRCRAG